MSSNYDPFTDPNYRVEGLPPAIRAKITAFRKAVETYAFVGAQMPEDRPQIEMDVGTAFYNLQRTIKTALRSSGETK